MDVYLTPDLSQADCSDLVSKWRGHTVATTFLLRSHCQTCTGCLEIFYVSTEHRPSASRTRQFPGARERDIRNESSSKRSCMCTGYISSTHSDNFEPNCHDRVLITLLNTVINHISVYCVLIQSSDSLLQIIHFKVMSQLRTSDFHKVWYWRGWG